MLLRRPKSFTQRHFYGNLEIIFIKINKQKLNLFEGLAHGEKLFCLRSTFKEVKHMSSKENYFACKEQHKNSKNHSTKYVKIAEYDFHVLNAVALLVFASETVKVVQYFSASNGDFNGISVFAFFFKKKRD